MVKLMTFYDYLIIATFTVVGALCSTGVVWLLWQ